MFNLSLSNLVAIGIPAPRAQAFLQPLQHAFDAFQINTAVRAAAFMGQVMVESNSLAVMEEGLTYTTAERILKIFPDRVASLAQAQALVRNPEALANTAYAGKGGNGDAKSGDGWRYHGRGPIQTTTLNNYTAAAIGCKRPYVLQPELLLTPTDGCLASAFFWKSNGLNEVADRIPMGGVSPVVSTITRKVNHAMLAADERLKATQRALSAFFQA